MKKIVIVGAGFAGCVCAEQLASAGCSVVLIERRSHIAGNAYDAIDGNGILIHPYGPHIFHTNAKRVFMYLSQFTDWRFYEHRVLASREGELYPVPINRTTINKLYGMNLDDAGIEDYLNKVRTQRSPVLSSEDVVLNSVGADLCEKFFRGYTLKQWGKDLAELSAGVAARVPARCNDDDRYFSDSYQFMPAAGYTSMFERMLDHSAISLRLNTDFMSIRDELVYDHLIYTGPIDAFYDYRFGRLPYRSIHFEHWHMPERVQVQPVGTMNFPDPADGAFTRITEFKHLTGQRHSGSSLVKEFPGDAGDPYYPVPSPENEMLYKKYQALARQAANVTFVGRLAQYRYYNMDQVVGAALTASQDIISLL